MEPKGLMKVGAGLAILAVVLGLVGGILRSASPGLRGSPELGMLELATGLGGMAGFLLLVWAIYRASALPWLPGTLLAGIALVFVGRFGANLLGLAMGLQLLQFNDGVGLLFTFLGTIGGLGTALTLVGLFLAVHAKVSGAPVMTSAPAPAAAPTRAHAGAPAPAVAAGNAPRRSSFRPPQGSFPVPKAEAPAPVGRAPPAR
jgi:hypothetical protein